MQNSSPDFVVEGRLLDGFLLLAAGGSSSPDDVVSVNLSSLQIADVAAEDLTFFGNLDSLDVSDNQLSYEQILGQLARLPRLSTLLLSCNSIASLEVPENSYRFLQTLDLSFNELHGDVLSQLAHLPRLVKLNLSSNCISSVPPEEELEGLASLEELNLGSNDLVQFVQWRQLTALQRLRRLSLASNRIKRLKDDAPDSPNSPGELSYFPALEELDLSGNEIVRVAELSAVRLFHSLRELNLSENPCSKGRELEQQQGVLGRRIRLLYSETKPWYLCGKGCHQKREKELPRRSAVDRRKLHKVRNGVMPGARRRGGQQLQLGVLDDEANQLLVELLQGQQGQQQGQGPLAADQETVALEPAAKQAPWPEAGQPREFDPYEGNEVFLTGGLGAGGEGPGPVPGDPMMAPPEEEEEQEPGASEPKGASYGEDLSEEDLDRIMAERRAKIERDFNAPVEEPPSFLRPPPFVVSVPQPGGGGASAGGSTASGGPGTGGSAGPGPQQQPRRRRSSSVAAGAGPPSEEQAADTGRTDRRESRFHRPSVAARSSPPPQAGSVDGASPHISFATAEAAMLASAAASRMLPPLVPSGSGRGSTASSGGGSSRGDPMDLLLRDAGATTASRPMPTVSVREAMKALRAAAMSEYAVAA